MKTKTLKDYMTIKHDKIILLFCDKTREERNFNSDLFNLLYAVYRRGYNSGYAKRSEDVPFRPIRFW